MRWKLCSHVTYRDIKVIYYLKCNMSDLMVDQMVE